MSIYARYKQAMEQGLTRLIRAAHVGNAPQVREVVADAQECEALAVLYGLPGIAALRGRFVLRHARGGVVAARLELQARVTQTCVVSLENFEAPVREVSELRFVPAASLPESEGVELDPETLAGPDEIPYAGEMLDLGAALAEQLALALDPYPRKPGAVLPAVAGEPAGNPFAVLRARREE